MFSKADLIERNKFVGDHKTHEHCHVTRIKFDHQVLMVGFSSSVADFQIKRDFFRT